MSDNKTSNIRTSSSNKPANSALGYKGVVTIKKQYGKTIQNISKQSNAGTEAFFKAILSAIVGYWDRADMPQLLDMGKKEGTTTFTSYLNYFPSITGILKDSAAFFTAYIPYSAISSDKLESLPQINCLRLLSGGSNPVELAYIEPQIAISLEKGQALIIEWKITISNINTTDEGGN